MIKPQTVSQGLQNDCWITKITGGLSVPAIHECLQVWDLISEVTLWEGTPDRFIWKWSPNGEYTAKSAHKMLHAGSVSFPGSSLIWRTWAPMKVKIFLWLAFRRRHWTADRRIRHNQEANEMCLLCDQEPETIDHIILFFVLSQGRSGGRSSGR